jgi:hypothetical protein
MSMTTTTAVKQQTKQQVFDQVVKHLLKQGKRAYQEGKGCRYRTDDGLKCAVGCLLPDAAYTPDMEGGLVGNPELKACLTTVGAAQFAAASAAGAAAGAAADATAAADAADAAAARVAAEIAAGADADAAAAADADAAAAAAAVAAVAAANAAAAAAAAATVTGDSRLLSALQVIHDYGQPADWRRLLRQFARTNALAWPRCRPSEGYIR